MTDRTAVLPYTWHASISSVSNTPSIKFRHDLHLKQLHQREHNQLQASNILVQLNQPIPSVEVQRTQFHEIATIRHIPPRAEFVTCSDMRINLFLSNVPMVRTRNPAATSFRKLSQWKFTGFSSTAFLWAVTSGASRDGSESGGVRSRKVSDRQV